MGVSEKKGALSPQTLQPLTGCASQSLQFPKHKDLAVTLTLHGITWGTTFIP